MRLVVWWRAVRRLGLVMLTALTLGQPGAWATVTVEKSVAGPSAPLHSVAVDPNDARIMMGASLDRDRPGLYRSSDQGANWQLLTPPWHSAWRALAIAFAPSDSNVIYVAGSDAIFEHEPYRYSAFGPQIYKSLDAGTTWNLVGNLPSSPQTPSVLASGSTVAVHPTEPDTLFVGISVGYSRFGVILKSTNGGATWERVLQTCSGGSSVGASCVNPFDGRPLHALALDPYDPSIMYVRTNQIYRSADAGSTWVPLGGPLDPSGSASSTLAIDPDNTDKVYFADDTGVFTVTVSSQTTQLMFAATAENPVLSLNFPRQLGAQLFQLTPNQPQLRISGGGAMGRFGFNARHDVGRGVPITSDPITISSTSSGGAEFITIEGGSYSINNGDFTSAPGHIQTGDRLQVKVVSATSLDSATSATLDVGGTRGVFTAVTRKVNRPPAPPNYFTQAPLLFEGAPVGYSFSMLANPADPLWEGDPDGDALTCHGVDLPSNATVTYDDAGQCTIWWLTKRGDAGRYVLRVAVSDGLAQTNHLWLEVDLWPTSPEILPFDEGSGSQTLYGGTLTNTTWQRGVNGNGLLFSGNGVATVPLNRATYDPSAFTYQAWIKPTTAKQTAYIMSTYNPRTASLQYALGLKNGALHAVVNHVPHDSAVEIPLDVWSSIAVTWDWTTVTMYLNGDKIYEAPYSVDLEFRNGYWPYDPLLIGARATSTGTAAHFVGYIDEVGLMGVNRLPDELCAEAGRTWTGTSCTGNAFSNTQPAAQNASIRVGASDVVTGTLTASDVNNDALNFVLVRAPTRGTVVIHDAATGHYSYRAGNTPGQTDSFTFAAYDRFARSNVATVSVQIGTATTTDTDGDAMSDRFEIAGGLSPADATDAAQDADGDMRSNYDESLLRTDPTIADEADPMHVLGLSFAEGVGTGPTIDATSYRHRGTINGARWIDGHNGYGLRFGGNNTVAIPDSVALDTTRAITLEMWIRPNKPLQNAFVAAKNVDVATSFAYGLGLANGTLRAQFGTTRYTSPFVVPVNVWTHVAVTWDGGIVRLYANGQQVYSASRSAGLPTNNNALLLGARSKVGGSAQGFRGDIDQVNVWKRARLDAEVCRSSGGTPDAAGCLH